VLSDSQVVHANAHENSDLFLALRGGGPNFGKSTTTPPALSLIELGIVTRYSLATNSDYRLWYSMNAYSADDLENVMKATVAVEEEMERDPRIGFFLMCRPQALVAGMLYMGREPPSTAFAAFKNIKPVAEPVPGHMGTQSSFAAEAAMPGGE
jgi:hypothetical protein